MSLLFTMVIVELCCCCCCCCCCCSHGIAVLVATVVVVIVLVVVVLGYAYSRYCCYIAVLTLIQSVVKRSPLVVITVIATICTHHGCSHLFL